MARDLQSGVVLCGRLHLHHTFGGHGEPRLLMIHGLGSSGYTEWRHNLPILARSRAVYAPDLPGFGQSDKPAVRYDIEFFTRAVERYMDRVGLRSAAVLGTSLGGRIAIELALRHPRRITRLVLVDALGLGQPALQIYYPLLMLPGVGESVMRTLRNLIGSASNDSIRRAIRRFTPGYVDEAYDDRHLDELRKAHRDDAYHQAYLSTVRSLARSRAVLRGDDLVARLAALRKPIQLIWGSADPLFPVSQGLEAHRRLPGSRIAVIEGAGHTPQAERPAEFNRVVDDFLARR